MTFRKLPSSRDFSIASTFVSCFFFFFGSGFSSCEAEVVMYRYVQGEWFVLFSEDVFYLISLRELSRKPSIPPLHEHQQSGWLLLPKGGIRRAVLATKKNTSAFSASLTSFQNRVIILFLSVAVWIPFVFVYTWAYKKIFGERLHLFHIRICYTHY